MRVVMFYHSLVSDWNHGNAHFLRGVVRGLLDTGHDVRVYEPANGWSRSNLVRDYGQAAVDAFHTAFPQQRSETYDASSLDLDRTLERADLVIVHEWNDPDLVARIGSHHARRPSYVLFFHDTHHRSVTDPSAMATYDLCHYDGVLAFGDRIRDRYLECGWTTRAWTWHEAADVHLFHPRHSAGGGRSRVGGDVVWIGNWGDEERTAELDEFLVEPVKRLGLKATFFGVRYPALAQQKLAKLGIEYGGWLPNYNVPEVFAAFKATVHIPRRPYLTTLAGIPTIRPFEALACGIPLVSARWDQTGGLFDPGADFLVADNGDDMREQLHRLVTDEPLRQRIAERGLATIRSRHTCAHRVEELMRIFDETRALSAGVKQDMSDRSSRLRSNISGQTAAHHPVTV